MNLSILLIGDVERAEFRPAAEAMTTAGTVARAADPEAAATRVEHEELLPDLIVVAVSYPGQFSAGPIERLRGLAPLARIVILLGSWCEGEMRSGRPWPGVVRIYAHQWPARFGEELARRAEGRWSWSLPVTTTDEERLLLAAERARPSRQGLVAVYTPQAALADFLTAACRLRGYAAVRLELACPTGVEGALAVLFDAGELGPAEEAALRRLAQRSAQPPAGSAPPIIALMDFPRTADCQRALAAGAAAVLSKPLLLDDLWWQLDVMRNAEC